MTDARGNEDGGIECVRWKKNDDGESGESGTLIIVEPPYE